MSRITDKAESVMMGLGVVVIVLLALAGCVSEQELQETLSVQPTPVSGAARRFKTCQEALAAAIHEHRHLYGWTEHGTAAKVHARWTDEVWLPEDVNEAIGRLCAK